MPVQKIDPKVIFASNAPAIDKPPIFSDKTKGWDVARANDGRPTIKEMNKVQQDTDLKILWLNENSIAPYDESIDYPDGAVTLKDGSLKQLTSGSWNIFIDTSIFANKDLVKRGIANKYDPSLSYNIGDVVKLSDSTEAISSIQNNTNDPNTDMTGWVKVNSARNENVLYASDFEIKGDGSDEFSKVQSMFNLANNKTLDFEGKNVSCGQQVTILNKYKFSLQNGGLKALSTSVTNTENRVLFLNNCHKFTIINFDNDANRQQRTPAEQAIHTVTMRSCKNFIVINSDWINGVCDNLHFDCSTPLDKTTHTQKGWFINCNFDNAYRNNLSVIVAQKMKFSSCKFTNANGTLPMAGVDIESNNFGGVGLIDTIIFEDCEMSGNKGWQFMPTAPDSPKNIYLTRCTIAAPDVSSYALLAGKLVSSGTPGSTALPDVSNTGGIQVTSTDVTMHDVTFKDFPLGSGTAMRVGANAGAFAALYGCKFLDINNGTFLTVQANDVGGGILLDQKCIFKNTTAIALGGARSEFKNSELDNIGLISSSSAAGKVIIDRLVAKNGKSTRFVYLDSNNAEVKNCELLDLNGASPVAYIQADKSGAVLDNNKCSATVQAQVVGIRFDNATAKRVTNNECVNLHTSTPYTVLNPTNLSSAIVSGNTGGTSNINTPVPIRGFSTALRPLATAVRQYSSIYDTTLNKELRSDGTNWRDANGAIVT